MGEGGRRGARTARRMIKAMLNRRMAERGEGPEGERGKRGRGAGIWPNWYI